LRALDPVVQATGPFQHAQQHARPHPREHEAPPEGQEQARHGEEDRVAERPQEQESCEDERTDELTQLHQPGSLDRSATRKNNPCSCASSARRLARSFGFSSITMTSSKNASMAGRSCASLPSALAYSRCSVAADTAPRSERIASKRRTSAGSLRLSTNTSPCGFSDALRRMLAMRLFAAGRLDDSSSSRNALSALRRASKSTGDEGRVASAASNISVVIDAPPVVVGELEAPSR